MMLDGILQGPPQGGMLDARGKGKFRRTQFFGFGINTGGSDSSVQCSNRTGVGWFGDSLECYLGYEDDELDVRKRFEVMKEAVETAYRLGLEDDDEETLKVFVAPEFFWRGPNGAYDAATILKNDEYDVYEFNAISEICEELEHLVKDKKYENWLFVFGTIIAASRNDLTVDNNYLFFNFAPILQGGTNGKKMLAPKEYVSSIDFLRPPSADQTSPTKNTSFPSTAVPWAFDVTDSDLSGKHHYDFDLWEELSEYLERERGYGLVRRNFFEVENVRFTLEICLDHAAGEAQHNFLKKGGGVHTGVHPADVSLISSAGMQIIDKNLILKDGGVVYHQDGLYNRTSDARRREMIGQLEKGNEKVSDEILDFTGTLFKLETIKAEEVVELWGGDLERIEKKMLQLFFLKKTTTPRIVKYAKVELPR
ncbi:hypothetical protein TrCOL_g483 [Triparma columacea]|uniref:Uncharacterized protein n=1 Tax=Triparma columacea TaxID=722753 RepID=A0A9W7LA57_9STRA|nr:hypothetical protein TrCOL_g483 [Triparma columacea]